MFGALSGRIDLLVIGVLVIVQFNIVTGKYSKIISHPLFDISQFGTQISLFDALSGRFDRLVVGILILAQFNGFTSKCNGVTSRSLFDSSPSFRSQIKVFSMLFLRALTVWMSASPFLHTSTFPQVSITIAYPIRDAVLYLSFPKILGMYRPQTCRATSAPQSDMLRTAPHRCAFLCSVALSSNSPLSSALDFG
jgi:hypothetical protein